MPSEPPFVVRPPSPLQRSRISEQEIDRARRERRDPQVSQWDYLHLSGLRRGVVAASALIGAAEGPMLDLYCGTKPYLELTPWRPMWGLDIDEHFGRADVLGSLPLPFRDGSFGVVFCSQALHLVDDPVGTVEEIARILRPNGHVIATVPHLFLAEGPFERHWSRSHLATLFAEWSDVRILGIDGPGAAAAFVIGRIAMLAARRWSIARALFTPGVVVMNHLCGVLDTLLAPLHHRWAHSFVVVARRSDDTPQMVGPASDRR